MPKTTVEETELTKSIGRLVELLEKQPDALAKSQDSTRTARLGTNGAADQMVAGRPVPLDPTLSAQEAESDEDEDEESPLNAVVDGIAVGAADEEGARMEKAFTDSLTKAFADEEEVVNGANDSAFLKSLVVANLEGLDAVDADLRKALGGVEKRGNARYDRLEKAIGVIADAVAEIHKSVNLVAGSPARTGTKSVQAAGVLSKGMGGEFAKPTLSKAQIVDRMIPMMSSGRITALDVARFESGNGFTGIDQGLLNEIVNGTTA